MIPTDLSIFNYHVKLTHRNLHRKYKSVSCGMFFLEKFLHPLSLSLFKCQNKKQI